MLLKIYKSKGLNEFIMICLVCYKSMYASIIFHFFNDNDNAKLNFAVEGFYFKFLMYWFYKLSNEQSFSCSRVFYFL